MDFSDEIVSNQGERVTPSDREGLLRTHEARYRFIQRLVQPQDRVLDCACGSGYGIPFFLQRADRITAVDISPVAVSYAQKMFGGSRVEFRVSSAEDLPFENASFNVFSSFETIEHVENPHRLVDEAARVLVPDGLFVVSTPNRILSGLGPGEKPSNPFHRLEWSLVEFDAVLRRRFTHIRYYGQRIRCKNKFHPKYIASKIQRAIHFPDIVPIPYNRRTLERFDSDSGWHPENFIAVCQLS